MQSIAKTDDTAAQLFQALKNAGTDSEKAQAKQNAMDYVTSITEAKIETFEDTIIPTEEPVVEEEKPQTINPNEIMPKFEPKHEEKPKEEVQHSEYDLSGPAKKKRYAEMGLTWEEELFLQGVNIRNMKRDERIKFREGIQMKKDRFMNKLQEDWQREQAIKAAKAASDPEMIKFNNQRVFMTKILEELDQHHNVPYVMKMVDNLTPDIFCELLENPANVSAINQRDPEFIEVFKKMYGRD